jgi:hypothetical protein
MITHLDDVTVFVRDVTNAFRIKAETLLASQVSGN